MKREEAIIFIAQSIKSDVDEEKVAEAIKAIEQEPRKKGKWVDCGVSARCSDCGCKDYEYPKHHYCPYCGAKMESEG